MKLREAPDTRRKVIQARRNQAFGSVEVANILTGDLDLVIYDESDDEQEDPSFVLERWVMMIKLMLAMNAIGVGEGCVRAHAW